MVCVFDVSQHPLPTLVPCRNATARRRSGTATHVSCHLQDTHMHLLLSLFQNLAPPCVFSMRIILHIPRYFCHDLVCFHNCAPFLSFFFHSRVSSVNATAYPLLAVPQLHGQHCCWQRRHTCLGCHFSPLLRDSDGTAVLDSLQRLRPLLPRSDAKECYVRSRGAPIERRSDGKNIVQLIGTACSAKHHHEQPLRANTVAMSTLHDDASISLFFFFLPMIRFLL